MTKRINHEQRQEPALFPRRTFKRQEERRFGEQSQSRGKKAFSDAYPHPFSSRGQYPNNVYPLNSVSSSSVFPKAPSPKVAARAVSVFKEPAVLPPLHPSALQHFKHSRSKVAPLEPTVLKKPVLFRPKTSASAQRPHANTRELDGFNSSFPYPQSTEERNMSAPLLPSTPPSFFSAPQNNRASPYAPHNHSSSRYFETPSALTGLSQSGFYHKSLWERFTLWGWVQYTLHSFWKEKEIAFKMSKFSFGLLILGGIFLSFLLIFAGFLIALNVYDVGTSIQAQRAVDPYGMHSNLAPYSDGEMNNMPSFNPYESDSSFSPSAAAMPSSSFERPASSQQSPYDERNIRGQQKEYYAGAYQGAPVQERTTSYPPTSFQKQHPHSAATYGYTHSQSPQALGPLSPETGAGGYPRNFSSSPAPTTHIPQSPYASPSKNQLEEGAIASGTQGYVSRGSANPTGNLYPAEAPMRRPTEVNHYGHSPSYTQQMPQGSSSSSGYEYKGPQNLTATAPATQSNMPSYQNPPSPPVYYTGLN